MRNNKNLRNYIPFTIDDRDVFLNKYIIGNLDGRLELIRKCDNEYVYVGYNSYCGVSYSELFYNYHFKDLPQQVCGKLVETKNKDTMKVEVKNNKEVIVREYPYLGISEGGNIFYFITKNTGVRLHSINNSVFPIGVFSDCLAEENFKIFEGEITLSNNLNI